MRRTRAIVLATALAGGVAVAAPAASDARPDPGNGPSSCEVDFVKDGWGSTGARSICWGSGNWQQRAKVRCSDNQLYFGSWQSRGGYSIAECPGKTEHRGVNYEVR